jgi:hypothetical protein
MLAAGNDEPIPLNRVGDAGRIGFDQVAAFIERGLAT